MQWFPNSFDRQTAVDSQQEKRQCLHLSRYILRQQKWINFSRESQVIKFRKPSHLKQVFCSITTQSLFVNNFSCFLLRMYFFQYTKIIFIELRHYTLLLRRIHLYEVVSESKTFHLLETQGKGLTPKSRWVSAQLPPRCRRPGRLWERRAQESRWKVHFRSATAKAFLCHAVESKFNWCHTGTDGMLTHVKNSVNKEAATVKEDQY